MGSSPVVGEGGGHWRLDGDGDGDGDEMGLGLGAGLVGNREGGPIVSTGWCLVILKIIFNWHRWACPLQ